MRNRNSSAMFAMVLFGACSSAPSPMTMPPSFGNGVRLYKGHSGAVVGVTWSPDGARAASAGDDRTAQVWDPATGEMLLTYKGHTAAISGIAWSPDRTKWVTGSDDSPPGSGMPPRAQHSPRFEATRLGADSCLVAGRAPRRLDESRRELH